MRFRRALPMLICALSALCGTGAEAQEVLRGIADVGQPSEHTLPIAPARVPGFGSARFGMDRSAVVQAIAQDFGVAAAARVSPGGGTDDVVIALPELSQHPVPTARFAFAEGALAGVKISWELPGSGPDREALTRRAAAIAADLYARSWPLWGTRRGYPLSANTVLVFSGEDVLGDGVELVLSGVDYTARMPDGSSQRSPAASGPASLSLAYARDIRGRFFLREGDF